MWSLFIDDQEGRSNISHRSGAPVCLSGKRNEGNGLAYSKATRSAITSMTCTVNTCGLIITILGKSNAVKFIHSGWISTWINKFLPPSCCCPEHSIFLRTCQQRRHSKLLSHLCQRMLYVPLTRVIPLSLDSSLFLLSCF